MVTVAGNVVLLVVTEMKGKPEVELATRVNAGLPPPAVKPSCTVC